MSGGNDIPAWVMTQKRTFTRWCNVHLKESNIVIRDLQSDFSDGLKLIALYEVLAQKQVKKYNKETKHTAHKLDNIQIALDHIKSEDVELVNIRKLNIVYIVCHHRMGEGGRGGIEQELYES